MNTSPPHRIRLGTLGGAVALSVLGVMGTAASTVVAGSPAGADTAPFTTTCTLAGATSAISGIVVTGSISPNPVKPGGSFTLSGSAIILHFGANATKLKGQTISGRYTSVITATGATPASQTVVYTIPKTVVKASDPPITAPSSAVHFTADKSGASRVVLSDGGKGVLSVHLGSATIPGPCTNPVLPISSAPIALPAGNITSVVPNSGPKGGGMLVTIHGSHLGNPTAVNFGSTPALSFSGRTDNSLVAVAPPGTGTVDVHVQTSGGASSSTSSDRFTYTDAAIVTGVSPNSSTPGGGTQVTVTGKQFAGATAVTFGSAPAASYTVNSSTSIIATAPSGIGEVDVKVTTARGTSMVNPLDVFNYRSGYRITYDNGGLISFGYAPNAGSAGSAALNKPIVGVASTPDGGGYWQVATDGGVFAYGDAGFFGSAGGMHLNKPIVGMAATPDGRGYWLVASDGGVFTYGDAGFFGSTGGTHLNKPIVGMAPTVDGQGYWLVASDGGVFAYGDATFHGSTGGLTLRKPAVGIAAAPGGGGYLIVTADGGVFGFGSAHVNGSLSGIHLQHPVVGIATTPDGRGYWMAGSNGAVFAFGDAPSYGGAVGLAPSIRVVGISSVA